MLFNPSFMNELTNLLCDYNIGYSANIPSDIIALYLLDCISNLDLTFFRIKKETENYYKFLDKNRIKK